MANLGYLQLTRRCVQSCRFCSNPPTGVELHEDELRRLVDDLVDRGYDGVILTGGEPTMSPLLLPALRHARQRGLHSRIITNGQILADRRRFEACVEAGLTHLHLSIHSHLAEVHDFITRSEGSHERALACLDHAGDLGVSIDINTVICSYNALLLDAAARFFVERFGFLRHFVYNNLDPHNDRVAEHPEAVARLHAFAPSLDRALAFLEAAGRTFRVERVPLCAMPRFPWASTETRKIVKEEERCVRFLDEKGLVEQQEFLHGKGAACDACRWDPVCAGLFDLAGAYDERELSPVFEDPLPVVRAVLGREPAPDLLERILARRGRRSTTEQP